MQQSDIKFYLPRAQWLVHSAVPMYLDAVGLQDEADFFRDTPVVTEKALLSGRVMFGKLKRVQEIDRTVMTAFGEAQNALPREIRMKWRGTMDCPPSGVFDELCYARNGFDRSRMGWELKGIVSSCCALLLARNNWDDSDAFIGLGNEVLDALRVEEQSYAGS